jgi:hypothetical protein
VTFLKGLSGLFIRVSKEQEKRNELQYTLIHTAGTTKARSPPPSPRPDKNDNCNYSVLFIVAINYNQVTEICRNKIAHILIWEFNRVKNDFIHYLLLFLVFYTYKRTGKCTVGNTALIYVTATKSTLRSSTYHSWFLFRSFAFHTSNPRPPVVTEDYFPRPLSSKSLFNSPSIISIILPNICNRESSVSLALWMFSDIWFDSVYGWQTQAV